MKLRQNLKVVKKVMLYMSVIASSTSHKQLKAKRQEAFQVAILCKLTVPAKSQILQEPKVVLSHTVKKSYFQCTLLHQKT